MAIEGIEKMKDNERLIRACSEAMDAHGSPTKPFNSSESKSEVIFSFPGTWYVKDWYSKGPFGTAKIDRVLFPSLRSIGNDEKAEVNEAFQQRFQAIQPELERKVQNAVRSGKKIVFTGHSSGGPIAALATIWFLEYCVKHKIQVPSPPLCLTFGSPLVGNHIFSHALRREKWSGYFFHYVGRYDIVPRVFLAPLSSIEQQFQEVLDYFRLQSKRGSRKGANDVVASQFFLEVISNALTLTSHVACKLMESGNLLLETVTSFLELSTYRPFGNYVFYDESEGSVKLVALDNSEAVLQLLFYSCQPSNDEETSIIAKRSLEDHLVYKRNLDTIFNCNITSNDPEDIFNKAADEFEFSPRGRLCLLAAKEAEEQKIRNQMKVELKKVEIENALNDVENYRKTCELHGVGYFDSFKLQNSPEDFKANVKRLELAGLWDEIIEMLKSYRLPDGFEGQKDWIKIGTRFRREVEPLDIANYYRHLKNEDTGPYMKRPRPKRYRYPQRWLEHENKVEENTCGESLFWAEIEELRYESGKDKDDFKERASKVQTNLLKWWKEGVIEADVFLSNSTFVTWWKSLQSSDKMGEIQALVCG